jgi:hypothetical protein
MTIYVANTGLTQTFDYWRNRTNELSYSMSTKVVTVESNTTIGNCHIDGNVWANSITIGNNTANTIIYSPTNAQKQSGDYFLNADGTWVLSPTTTSNGSVIGGGSDAVIDTFPINDFASAEYLVTIKDASTGSYQTTKIVLVQDGTDVYSTEYATLWNRSRFCVFSTSKDSANIKLQVKVNAPSFLYKFSRVAL